MRGSVVKRGEGRYSIVYRVVDPGTGKTKQKWKGGFTTKRSAESALKEVVSSIDAGTYTAPTKITLGEYLTDRWLPAMATTLRPSTLSMYRTNVASHIVPELGGTQLRALAPDALNRFYADRLANGRRDGSGGLSRRSVRILHVIIHRALRDAVRWGLVSRNVADAADPPRDGSPEKDVWSSDQVGAFLVGTTDDRLSALWRLAAATGLRRGELLGLRWSDVDLDAGQLRVRQNLVVVDHQPVVSEPKTNAAKRTVSFDPATATILRQHRTRQATERLAWGPAYADTDLVFTREDGSPVHPERMTKAFGRLAKTAGLPAVSFHGLRHAHATALLKAGVPLRVVSQRLGHASPAVTLNVYSHVLPGDDQAAALTAGRLLEAR